MTVLAPPGGLIRRRLRPGRFGQLVVQLDAQTTSDCLVASLVSLQDQEPAFSAERTLSHRQHRLMLVALACYLVLLVVFPLGVLTASCAFFTVVYALAVGYRLLCFRRGVSGGGLIQVSDADALAAEDLPRYTILVPAFREPEVIGQLITNLASLNYPRRRLDVLILLEEEDAATLASVRAARPGAHVRVVIVPPSQLKTKPKACNYGLQLARGELVTIYDAEDQPEPLQLRRVAVAFRRAPLELVCLQARLGYFNASQNLITRWFTAEYLTWFGHFLPGLVALGAPVPLGGTSNHMRADVLRELGGWDPYNVTEDADLGLRLHRRGYRTGVLDSLTLEEANSDFVNWAKQRSRWYKGYLQTWLVHMRSPRTLRKELGWKGFIGMNLFVGGTPVLAALNPIFWVMTLLWFVGHPPFIERIFPGIVYYPAMVCWILGNFTVLYVGLLSIREARRPELLGAALLMPVYWVMMSLAAIKAAIQLVQQPSFWEKTTHGLHKTADSRQHDEAVRRADA